MDSQRGRSHRQPQKELFGLLSKINDLLVAMDQGYRPKIKLPFYEGRQFLK